MRSWLCAILFIAMLPCVAHAQLTTVAISPNAKQQFLDNNGKPLNGGKLFTYAAGTTTKLATYTDSTGATPNTNPIILNSRGEANVWLTNAAFKFVLSPSTDTDPPTNAIWTVDNLGAPVSLSSSIFNVGPTQLHQNQGGLQNCAHSLQWIDNLGLICGDHHVVITKDASMLISIAPTGTVTTGEIIGFNGIIGGVTYTVKYTIQSSDGNYINVLTNLFTCLKTQANPGCSIVPSAGLLTLQQALAAYTINDNIGYSIANGGVNSSPALLIDWPWGGNNSDPTLYGGNTITAISSANTTLTIVNLGLDGGPFYNLARSVPGRTPQQGDRHGILYFENQAAASDASTTVQGASISTYLTVTGLSGYDTMKFATGQAFRMDIGQGVYFDGLNDPGAGNMRFATYQAFGPNGGFELFDRVTGNTHNSIWYRSGDLIIFADSVKGTLVQFTATGSGVDGPYFPYGTIWSNSSTGGFKISNRDFDNGNTSQFYRSNDSTRLFDNTAGDVITYNTSGFVFMPKLATASTGHAVCFNTSTGQLTYSASGSC